MFQKELSSWIVVVEEGDCFTESFALEFGALTRSVYASSVCLASVSSLGPGVFRTKEWKVLNLQYCGASGGLRSRDLPLTRRVLLADSVIYQLSYRGTSHRRQKLSL